MALSVYNTGTVTVGAGSTTVNGAGTAFVAGGLREGDIFWANGLSCRIATVVSNTRLTLAYGWPGAAIANGNYEVAFTPDAARLLANQAAVLEVLRSGNASALAALAGTANKLPYFTGAGTMALADISDAARGLLDDASVTAMRQTLQLVKQTSLSDATRTRMLEVGSFGIGTTALEGFGNASMDDLPIGAWCKIEVTTTGTPVPGVAGVAFTAQFSGVSKVQELHTFFPSTSLNQKWVRCIRNEEQGWTPWKRLDPERGSNANGDYTRFSDGTQICVGSIITSANGPTTWTFPAAFVSGQEAYTVATPHSVAPRIATTESRTATSVGINLLNWSGARGAIGTHVMTIGRWF